MSLSDELYRETILDHYHHPRNRGVIENSSTKVEGVNPLCGDELTLYLTVEGNTIKDIKLTAKGCSINTASGSMMTEAVFGQSLTEVQKIIDAFKHMMLESREQDISLPANMEELEALQGVKKYPVRIKCAILPWNTLAQAIKNVSANTNEKSTKVEMN